MEEGKVSFSVNQRVESTEILYRNVWKARQSQIDGYSRQYYTTTPVGDSLEIDYNYGRSMARITVGLASEHGRVYTAVIKSGTVLKEYELATRRPLDLTSRISLFRSYFLHLPDESLLSVIGGNYGIPSRPMAIPRRRYRILPQRPGLHPIRRIQKYFERKRRIENEPAPLHVKFLRRLPAEIMDFGTGGLIFLAYLQHSINLGQFAGLIGFLGVFSGAIDWVIRQRSPFIPRIALLLGASGYAVFMQMQYRVWSIFL